MYMEYKIEMCVCSMNRVCVQQRRQTYRIHRHKYKYLMKICTRSLFKRPNIKKGLIDRSIRYRGGMMHYIMFVSYYSTVYSRVE